MITVPAYFDNKQRQETMNAAEKAGLTVLRLVSEPTAAAIAYNLSNQIDDNILIYDLGGGIKFYSPWKFTLKMHGLMLVLEKLCPSYVSKNIQIWSLKIIPIFLI